MSPISVVFVHGAGGTASTWASVETPVAAHGHRTLRVSNPLTSLTDDVAHTRDRLSELPDPILLVGHSYGGAVITNVGTDPRVRGLVYVAAFAPTHAESVREIVTRYPPAPVSPHMRRGPDGEWRSTGDAAYWEEIGWDVPAELRRRIMQERRPSADRIFTESTGEPAWRERPSWYVVAAEDKTLRPEAQRDMATRSGAAMSELAGSHYLPWTQPQALADIVLTAAAAVSP